VQAFYGVAKFCGAALFGGGDARASRGTKQRRGDARAR
jgi:hypothetical protein